MTRKIIFNDVKLTLHNGRVCDKVEKTYTTKKNILRYQLLE